MEKQTPMTRDARELLQKEYGLTKRSLHEQQAFLIEVMDFMRKRSCTKSEDKMRKCLMRICKLRLAKINQKINDLNTKIYQLSRSEQGDLLR
jgi:hypothetical protein